MHQKRPITFDILIVSKAMGCVFMYEIKLPTLDWFMHGNIFTGSFKPDPIKGCLCQTTFNYKVKIVKHNGTAYLAASCFYILPWNSCSNMEEMSISRFEGSDFGIETAENWIRNKFITDYHNGIPEKAKKALTNQKRYINSCNISL